MEVRIIITFIFIVMTPSLTEDVKKYLTGTEGGSITLPDPVMVKGFILFGVNILAMVEKRNIQIYEELYKDRLLWNRDTGLFTLTGLQRNDSGIYHINSRKGNIFTSSYELTVYESVPTPAVSTQSVSADDCTLLCFVRKAEGATLSWYKDEEILNQTGSVLSLPLSVHSQDFSFSYRCVAANPAESKTRPVNVTSLCSEQNNTDSRSNTNSRHYMIAIVIPIMLAVILIFAITWKCLDKNKRTIGQTQDSVTIMYVHYADTDMSKDRRSQGGNLPDPSGSADTSILTTVYYKPEGHRMVPIHTDTAYNV